MNCIIKHYYLNADPNIQQIGNNNNIFPLYNEIIEQNVLQLFYFINKNELFKITDIIFCLNINNAVEKYRYDFGKYSNDKLFLKIYSTKIKSSL
jgi:hypothetical protein